MDATSDPPADYSDALYRVYLEVGETDFTARDAITAFLVERSTDHPAFHFVPGALRALAAANIAIYQVRRLGPA